MVKESKEDFVERVYKSGGAGIGTLAKLTAAMSGEQKLYAKNSYASWGAACPRRAVFKHKISPDQRIPMGATSQFYFAGGTAFHEVIQKAFYDAGILHGAEIRVEYKGIAGFIDVVFEDEDGAMGLMDIKTCGSRIPSYPKIEYVQQLRTYGLLTGIDRLYILYMSRSVMNYKFELAWKMIKIPFGIQDQRNTASRLAWGLVGKELNLLPDIPSDMTSPKDCGWCNFKAKCWPADEKDPFPVTEFDWGREGEPQANWRKEGDIPSITRKVKTIAKDLLKYGKTAGNAKLMKIIEGS